MDNELPRRLTVMADYEAFPVWGPDSMIAGARLPSDDGLRHALAEWEDAYSRFNANDTWPPDLPYDSGAVEAAISPRG